MIIYIQTGKNNYGITGQVLQSKYLEFNHPITNKKMVFDLCVDDFGWKKVNERRASLEEVYLAVMGKDNER